jgi:hypothetical protein
MMKMHRLCLVSAIVILPLLPGCQTPSEPTPSPDRAAVSSIPWNRPASWEGTGALGGFMPQGGR